MVTEIEGTFEVEGASLYTKTWQPDGPPKAKLIVIHGFSDHIGRYYDLFPSLARAGIAVYGFDQRGWGQSVRKPAEKGLTGPTATVLADMAAFIESHLPPPDSTDDVPVFVLGHSMGGGQALTLASSPKYEGLVARVRGWVLESPFIAFSPEEKPSWLTVAGGRLAGKLMPHFHLVRVIAPENITRDPAVQQSIRDDVLMHNTGTLEGLAAMLDRTADLSSGRLKLSPKVRSLVVMHGDSDKTCSFQGSKDWFDAQKIEDGQFKAYEGSYHQLHADYGKEKFYKDVADWILARCDQTGSQAAAKL